MSEFISSSGRVRQLIGFREAACNRSDLRHAISQRTPVTLDNLDEQEDSEAPTSQQPPPENAPGVKWRPDAGGQGGGTSGDNPQMGAPSSAGLGDNLNTAAASSSAGLSSAGGGLLAVGPLQTAGGLRTNEPAEKLEAGLRTAVCRLIDERLAACRQEARREAPCQSARKPRKPGRQRKSARQPKLPTGGLQATGGKPQGDLQKLQAANGQGLQTANGQGLRAASGGLRAASGRKKRAPRAETPSKEAAS